MEKKCKFCEREDPKGLTWLWPDEKWICKSCLKRRMSHVLTAQ